MNQRGICLGCEDKEGTKKQNKTKHASQGKFDLGEDFICVCESALRLYRTTKRSVICMKLKLTLSRDEILTSTPCITGWPIKSKLWPTKWMFNPIVFLSGLIPQPRFVNMELIVSTVFQERHLTVLDSYLGTSSQYTALCLKTSNVLMHIC